MTEIKTKIVDLFKITVEKNYMNKQSYKINFQLAIKNIYKMTQAHFISTVNLSLSV